MRALPGLLLMMGLAACAEPVIPYDRGAGTPVNAVGVLTPSWPGGPTALLATSPGQSFGLVGGLITLAVQSARDSRFRDSLAGQPFDGQSEFRTGLLAAVAARGYQVIEVAAPTERTKFVEGGYAGMAAQARPDALLDCLVPIWGYIAAGIADSTPYRPYFTLRCRMVSAASGAVLMRDTIIYNPVSPTAGFVGLAPDPAYAFITSDDLMADPQKAVSGMRHSFERTADALGTLLK